jgi:RNA polymerase sigma factor (sigma-70 family)
MRYDSPVDVLLDSAMAGVESAWQEIVARYSPLVFTVCHRCGVMGFDAEDVVANVWLRLIGNLSKIREPKALPKWLMTTTRRECVVLLRDRDRHIPKEEIDQAVPGTVDVFLLDAERDDVVRRALAELSDGDRALLALLFSDPPTPYRTISAHLGIPVGAIGPTRQRCLARMRRIPSVAALAHDRHAPADSSHVLQSGGGRR